MIISRESVHDAKKLIKKFIPETKARKSILDFLANKIIYSHKISKNNWNLNLDKNGRFLRFNTGHEYCIQISKSDILILCIKDILKKSIKGKDINIIFQGYSATNDKIKSKDLNKTPDSLAKVPDSVGCIIQHEDFDKYISIISKANNSFIKFAIKNTTMLPAMKLAHSSGAIEYIKLYTKKIIPNPIYTISNENLERLEEKYQNEIKKISLRALEQKALEKEKVPQKVLVNSIQYIRDPIIVEYVKRKANGICQDCHQPAPFINKKTGEPYLEIHHIVPLSQGGSDTIDNVIALCPNCHRKRHYG